MDEEKLIKGCIKSDIKAQKALYDTYGSWLMGLCMRYTQNREDAEEVFHDAMMKVYRSIDKFKGDSKLKTWINKVGVNCALDFLRKKKNALIIEHISDNALEIKESDTEYEVSFEAEMAMSLLCKLSLNQQIIINLFVIDELSHKEIAAQLDISEEASRSQYSRAKRALAELVKMQLLKNEIRK
ncbi:MAG: sigma-70 family RNA polymerase sigma factor [Bacteroidia bacterium]|nr:sigma-70 family RNA polymerase sigma factor [Bacteroidia bacterium]